MQEGKVHYIEYKTSNWIQQQWVTSWFKSPQLHIYAEALRRCDVEVASMTIEGLFKGGKAYRGKNQTEEEKLRTSGSILIYGYRRKGVAPFYKDEWSYKAVRGWKKAPVWSEYPGGVKAWIKGMPDSVLGEQFVATPPITPNPSIADAWLRQRKMREWQINLAMYDLSGSYRNAEFKAEIMDAAFSQNFDACTPSFGTACSYTDICHGAEDLNPLTAGYQWRVPHHTPEAEQMEEKEEENA